MANRRMFSLAIVDTDEFLDMQATAQNLYFHLGMRADDDGFVSNPKKIMRIINSFEDDIKLLIVKGFIEIFGNGIVFVTNWRENNDIRWDRYHPSKYQFLKPEYDFGKKEMTSGIPLVNQGLPSGSTIGGTEVRLGKDRYHNKSDSYKKKNGFVEVDWTNPYNKRRPYHSVGTGFNKLRTILAEDGEYYCIPKGKDTPYILREDYLNQLRHADAPADK